MTSASRPPYTARHGRTINAAVVNKTQINHCMTFKKGQSGNPKGRAIDKERQEFKKLCQALSPLAIERLGYWLSSDDPTASIAAAKAILDRAYGKPAQSIDINAEKTITYVVRAPAAISTAKEWAEKHQQKTIQ